MSFINRILSRLQFIPSFITGGKQWSKYLNMRLALVLLLLGGVSFVVVKSGAQDLDSLKSRVKKPEKFINLDIRVNDRANLDKVIARNAAGRGNIAGDITQKAREQAFKINQAIERLKKTNPTVEVTISPLTGAVEIVRSNKTLTKANRGRDGKDIALDFIQENRQLYGLDDADIRNLHFVGESVNETSGLRLVIFEQKVNDRLIFQGECKISIDREGRVIQALGNLVPQATARASAIENLISPQEALVKTMATVGVALDAGAMKAAESKSGDLDVEITVDGEQIKGKVTSSLVYFPVAPGVLIPAWSQTIFGAEADWYALADATDGTLLWRKNIRANASTQQARFSVYVQADGSSPADSPAPLSPSTMTAGFQPPEIARTTVNMLLAQNITASPDGWITDGVTTTTGNNVDAYLDRDNTNTPDTGALDNNGRPTGNLDSFGRNRDFLGVNYAYTPPPNAGNPEAGTAITDTQLQRGAVTQLFYLTNWYHDKLFALGFTPGSRNFQTNNFLGGGLGTDPVLAETQDSAALAATATNRNNANFSTPADGTFRSHADVHFYRTDR